MPQVKDKSCLSKGFFSGIQTAGSWEGLPEEF
jgi:hypothetical protein